MFFNIKWYYIFKEYDVSKNQIKDWHIPKPRVCFNGRKNSWSSLDFSIRNEIFNHIDEPEVICLGNGKDWDYNDNRSSKDLPYSPIKEFQG